MILCYVRKRDKEKTYKFNVLTGCEEDGRCELLTFLLNLEGHLANQAIRTINLLERMASEGPPTRMEVCHQIRGPIYQCEQGRIRILWFYDAGQMIICSHGFIKKTQKTPKKEIERALAMYNRYHRDKAANEITILEDRNNPGDNNETKVL